MNTTSALRRAAIAVAVPGLALTLAAPAEAAPKDQMSSRTSGVSASASWTEYDLDDSLGLPGNTHVGYLGAEQGGFGNFVYGDIQDYDCDPGEVPGGGHGGGGEEGLCDLLGVRYLEDNGTTLTVDTRAGVARLTGSLLVTNGGHGEPGSVLATPPVDMTWTSVGGMATFRSTETWSDGTVTYRSSVRGTASTETVVTGAIGRMGFADDADDESGGEFRQWREMSRTRVG